MGEKRRAENLKLLGRCITSSTREVKKQNIWQEQLRYPNIHQIKCAKLFLEAEDISEIRIQPPSFDKNNTHSENS